jgi:endonuclease YncB( thermonuclease family)
VDAPEWDQVCAAADVPYPCGKAAEDALAGLVRGREVRCERVGRDRHGRTVARCAAGGRDLGGELVRLGWALDRRRFSEGFYAGTDAKARRARRGLWAGTFDRPWDWRRKRGGRR